MIPILSIVGPSGAGKTALLERLVPELQRRGYRVAVIKHAEHGFDSDIPGKDSWRLWEAGSQVVVLASASKMVTLQRLNGETSLEEIAAGLSGVDLILSEGYKSGSAPKIAVHGEGVSLESLGELRPLFAVVTIEDLPLDVPRFSPHDARGLADLVEEGLIKQRSRSRVTLLVDGRPVPVYQKFVGEIVEKTVRGMIGALRGGEEARRIQILIEEPDAG